MKKHGGRWKFYRSILNTVILRGLDVISIGTSGWSGTRIQEWSRSHIVTSFLAGSIGEFCEEMKLEDQNSKCEKHRDIALFTQITAHTMSCQNRSSLELHSGGHTGNHAKSPQSDDSLTRRGRSRTGILVTIPPNISMNVEHTGCDPEDIRRDALIEASGPNRAALVVGAGRAGYMAPPRSLTLGKY